MKKRKPDFPHPETLRQRAEDLLPDKPPENAPSDADAYTIKLYHELQVQQMELVLQNDELRRARDEIEAGLERYTDLYEFAPVAYLTLDHQGAILQGNLAAASLLGIEWARLPGRRLGLLVSPDTRPEFDRFLKDVFENYTKKTCEVTIPAAGNQRLSVRLEARLSEKEGECRLALVDVTDIRRAEETLHYQANLLLNVKDAVIATDLQFIIQSWNPAAEEMYGWKAGEVIGHSMTEIARTEYTDQETREAAIQTLAERGYWHGEVIQPRRDGAKFPVLSTVSWIKNLSGKPVGVVAVNRDISARKHAEEQIHYHATLLDNVRDAVVASDGDYRLAYWNKAAEALYGWKAEEVLGRLGLEVLQTQYPEADKAKMLRLIADTGSWTGEVTQLCKDGSRIPVEVASIVIRDNQGQITNYISVNRDISERLKAEERTRYLASFPQMNSNPVLELDSKGRFTFQNTTASAILEKAGAPPDGRAFLPADIDDLLLRLAHQETGSLNREVTIGSTVIDEGLQLMPQYNVIRIYGRNITQRKKAEQALVESEERFRTMSEHSPAGIFIAQDERIIYANSALEKMFGYLPAELIGANSNMFVRQDDNALVGNNIQPQPNGETTTSRYDLRILSKNGQIKQIEILGGVIKLNNRPAIIGHVVDITERKRMEENLRASEERFKAIASNTPDHILMQDRRLRYTLVVNPQLGVTEEEMIGKTDYDFLSREEADRLTRVKTQVIETRKPVKIESSLISRKGEVEYFDGTYVPKFDAQGRVDGLIGYFRNITERKQAEEQIRYQASLLNNVRDAVAAADGNQKLTYWNKAAEALYGWKAEEVLGRQVLEVLQTEYPGIDRPEMLRQIAETGSFTSEATQVRKDGARIPVEVGIIVIRDNQGQITNYVSVNRDISRRKKGEQALVESETRFRALSENSLVGIYIAQDRRLTYVNSALAEMLGYLPAELIGSDAFNLVYPDDHAWVAENLRLRFSGESPVTRYEFRGVCKNGELKQFEVLGAAIDLGGKPSIIGNIIDITGRKQAEEQALYQATLLDNVRDAVVATDANFRLTYLNKAAEALYGWKAEEVLCRSGFEVLQTEYPGVDRVEMLRQVTDTGSWTGEVIHMRKDGSRIPVEAGIIVIRDNQGQITNYVTVNRDISQRKKAEQALVEGETLFRTLGEKSLAGIYIIQDGRLAYVNSALAEMFGYLPGEMIGADPLFFIHPDDRAQAAESILLRLAGKVKNARF